MEIKLECEFCVGQPITAPQGKMRFLWKLLKFAGMTILVCAVALILIAEYRSYADKVEQHNSDASKRTIQTDAPRRIYLNRAETIAIRRYVPLLNEVIEPTPVARQAFQDAFSQYVCSTFEQRLQK